VELQQQQQQQQQQQRRVEEDFLLNQIGQNLEVVDHPSLGNGNGGGNLMIGNGGMEASGNARNEEDIEEDEKDTDADDTSEDKDYIDAEFVDKELENDNDDADIQFDDTIKDDIDSDDIHKNEKNQDNERIKKPLLHRILNFSPFHKSITWFTLFLLLQIFQANQTIPTSNTNTCTNSSRNNTTTTTTPDPLICALPTSLQTLLQTPFLANLLQSGTDIHTSYFGTTPPNIVTVRKMVGIPEKITEEVPPIVTRKEVEEIVWVDNVKLEGRERDLRRKRRMIREYEADLEAVRVMEGEFTVMERDFLQGSGSEEDGEEEMTMEGIAGVLEGKTNRLSRALTHERRKLEEWNRATINAENAFDAVVLDDGYSKNSTARMLARAKANLKRFVDVSMFAGVRPISNNDVEILFVDDLLEIINVAYKQILQNGSSPVNKALLETIKEHTQDEEEEVVKSLSIGMADIVKAQESLMSKCAGIMADLKNDTDISESIAIWVNDTIYNITEQILPYQDPDESTYIITDPLADTNSSIKIPPRLLPNQIQAIIDSMLEIQHADQTDRLDYATIRSGSRVIRTGPRQTTPSLSERLPLGNRVLAKLNLKFYGHRAESALNPTYPLTSPGQCWSFEEEGSRKDLWTTAKSLASLSTPEEGRREIEDMMSDPYRGNYATLAVRLARPTRVEEVVVEHMGKDATALKGFRVFGFEDRGADSMPWDLGTFTFDVDRKGVMQKFSVTTSDEKGRPLPHLSSIVLAIDSNWGGDFTCLYRFRVHGN